MFSRVDTLLTVCISQTKVREIIGLVILFLDYREPIWHRRGSDD